MQILRKEVDDGLSEIKQQLEAMMALQQAQMMAKDRVEESSAKAVYTPPHQPQTQGSPVVSQGTVIQNPSMRLEFPEFHGEDPRSLLRRANRYFQIHLMDELAKVNHASYYMMGSADLWYYEYVEGKQHVHWDYFCNMLRERFLTHGHEDIVVDFTQLMQRSDVTSYVETFEEMKSLVRAKHPTLTEEFFISCL